MLHYLSKVVLITLAIANFETARAQALNGFNEMLISSHLQYIGQWNQVFSQVCGVAPLCPQSQPTMYSGTAANLLYNLKINGRTQVIRDILPIKVIEPSPGYYPLDSEIASVLKVYQGQNVELILAFGAPLPTWMVNQANSSGGDAMANQMSIMASSISYFLARMQYWYGVDPTWMAQNLKIEP